MAFYVLKTQPQSREGRSMPVQNEYSLNAFKTLTSQMSIIMIRIKPRPTSFRLFKNSMMSVFTIVTGKVRKYDAKDKDFMTQGLLKSCQVRDKLLKNITQNKIAGK